MHQAGLQGEESDEELDGVTEGGVDERRDGGGDAPCDDSGRFRHEMRNTGDGGGGGEKNNTGAGFKVKEG